MHSGPEPLCIASGPSLVISIENARYRITDYFQAIAKDALLGSKRQDELFVGVYLDPDSTLTYPSIRASLPRRGEGLVLEGI